MSGTLNAIRPVSLLEHAVSYVEDHALTLCLVRHATKIPILREWNDPNRVLDTRAAVVDALSNNSYNIGVVHERSRTATGDIDDVPGTRLLFDEFGWDYDELFAAFPRIRSRDGKDKILFRLPDGFNPGSDGITSKIKLNWPNPYGECDAQGKIKLITVFELRGGQNQDVLPPSIHPDTKQPYAWCDGQAPWDFNGGIPTLAANHPLLIIWAQWDTFRPQLESACPWAPRELQQPIPTVQILAPQAHSDVIGQYNRRIPCADLLERNGYVKKGKRWLAPHSETKIPGVITLEGGKIYSHHGSDVLNTGHAHDSFSLLTVLEYHGSIEKAVAAAANAIGIGFGADPIPSIDVSALIRNGLNKSAKPSVSVAPVRVDSYTFPSHLLDVPGLVGEVADYILSTSIFPQPVLAMAASLAWCGAIMGRKVRTATDVRTNLYAMGVADSGSGKEHARKALKRLAVASGMTRYIGAEKLASDQGLFALLDSQPACLALLDEFGRTLRVINNDRAPAHLQQLMTTIMELFGSADSYIIEKIRAEHTNGAAPRQIVAPNLCIYATTVPGRLYQGLTPDEITDGFLPRFLVFESDTPDPDMCAAMNSEPSAALIEQCAAWHDAPTNAQPTGNLDNLAKLAPVHPRLIPMTDEADNVLTQSAAFWRARKKETRGSGLDAVWARAFEHAARLALIVAAGSGGVIDRATAAWSCELTDFLLERSCVQAQACVASNEYEGTVQRVQVYIREQGQTTLAALTRKFRAIKPKERDGILSALLDAQQIEVSTSKTAGRATTTIVWVDGKEGNKG